MQVTISKKEKKNDKRLEIQQKKELVVSVRQHQTHRR
jgi:hypothetical protein